jgi:hypothetical protein
MKKIPTLSIKDPAAISVLAKLLGAARRAESEGKYLAMSKLMETANKISDKISNSEKVSNKKKPPVNYGTNPYSSFFDTLQKIKFYPNYIPVQGEIVE